MASFAVAGPLPKSATPPWRKSICRSKRALFFTRLGRTGDRPAGACPGASGRGPAISSATALRHGCLSGELHASVQQIPNHIAALFASGPLDTTVMLLVLVPALVPAARLLGIDLVHFGLVVTVNMIIGMVSPP
ncbi:TRAP transporter large permease subunit [Mesorhizobium sp. CO1-1-8]|uniref:TRAP transporter large permease subunit n=1 Tax=Mesorhizobium sp. CO1-1-8 TaxID=2876631 RepID=UPI001CD0CBEB|nr:TRAP transporter large permease subunit [Mesorhizobium sp. CO1-1-8]